MQKSPKAATSEYFQWFLPNVSHLYSIAARTGTVPMSSGVEHSASKRSSPMFFAGGAISSGSPIIPHVTSTMCFELSFSITFVFG